MLHHMTRHLAVLILTLAVIVWPGAVLSTPARSSLPAELLFVPTENETIDIYDLTDPGKGPVASISGLHAFQSQMVVDKSDDLFVVNNGTFGNDDYVSEFAPPYGAPPTILSTAWQGGTQVPIGVAADVNGTVFVTTCGVHCRETPRILVYPQGSTVPTQAITAPQFSDLGGLAFDRQGDLFVGSWNDSTFGADVFKIPAGSTTAMPLGLHGLVAGLFPGVSLDANGDLFVSSANGTAYVLEFKPGQHDASRVIRPWSFQDPLMIDVGPDGNLYVPTDCTQQPCPSVYAFKPGAKKAFETVGTTQNIGSIEGVATAPNLQLEDVSAPTSAAGSL